MALIKCPECKRIISDQCGKCPNCGFPIEEGSVSANESVPSKKPIFKFVWFWLVVGVVLLGAILSLVFFLNRETQPKLDADGNPVYIELTNEVYTNAGEYLGYHVNVSGKVFQVMGDNGNEKSIQVWLDPDTCEQNLMISYTSSEEVKQGDYIMCSGYIDSVTEYSNVYGAELRAPLVFSNDLLKSTYIDVVAPTTDAIVHDSLKRESLGYSVAVNKIEFSEKETRVYLTVTNSGAASLFVGEAVIIQDGKQYKAATNYEANYDELPYEVVKGASSSGIIVFPPLIPNDFELTIDIHSSEDERVGDYTFLIGKNTSSVKGPEQPLDTIVTDNLKQEKYGYSVSIDKVEFYRTYTVVFISASNKGKDSLYVDVDGAVAVQDGKQYNTIGNIDYDELPYEIVKDATASGVVILPPISTNDFEFIIDVHSDNLDEDLGEIIATVSLNGSSISKPWSKDETEKSNDSNNSLDNNEQVDRYEEAVLQAEISAQFYFPTDRENIMEVLLNPSLEDGFDGYTNDEASYAIENANIDWSAHALQMAKDYLDEQLDDWVSPETIISMSELYDHIYTQEELAYVIDNCGLDWNDEAVKCTECLFSEDYDEDVCNKEQIYSELLNLGFTEVQAAYGIENCSIDWDADEEFIEDE